MSDTLKSTSLYDETTPVLIVGGGLVGLSTSLFLSWHGIHSLLVERHPSTAIHPRAIGMTPRTMELFHSVGAVEEIRKVESPFPEESNVLLVESLVGQVFDNLQDEAELGDLFIGPVPGSAIAQDVLEPVLRARAECLGGDLRFGTELVAFEQDEEGITATIRERASGGTRTVRAQLLVAADGSHSGIRQELGIGKHGAASLFHCISMIFEADLMELFRKQHAVMCFLSNDTLANGALVPYPGSSARPDLFRLDIGYVPGEETLTDYPEARCLQLIRAAVITGDLTSVNAGSRYSAGAILQEAGDEHLPLAQRPDQWKGQPGTHAPYLVLEREGKPISTLDLFGSHFVLLVGPAGQHWKAAARRTKGALHLPLDSYQIGGEAGNLIDTANTFCDAYGITATGAVIIRPDGFIGWRSKT